MFTSSPKHSQSNGMVEKYIGTIKNIFKKLDEDPSKDSALALLEYRNTPIDKNLKSPNEIMFSRKLRGLLPIKIDQNKVKEYNKIKNQLLDKQLKQKEYYDKNARDLKPIKINYYVIVKKELNKPLVSAKVTNLCDRPRSYEVELTDSERKIERNRKHLIGPVENKNHVNNKICSNLQNKNESNIILNEFEKGSSPNIEINNNDEIRTRSGRISHKPDRLIESI